jgi:hypothetical protein
MAPARQTKPLAIYECLTCHHKWQQRPGFATCPVCVQIDPTIATWKDHYVKWSNYEAVDWLGDNFGNDFNTGRKTCYRVVGPGSKTVVE